MDEPEDRYRDRANAITKLVYDSINAEGEIFLTSTIVKNIFAIRVVSANPLANELHLRNAFDILVRMADKARGGFL